MGRKSAYKAPDLVICLCKETLRKPKPEGIRTCSTCGAIWRTAKTLETYCVNSETVAENYIRSTKLAILTLSRIANRELIDEFEEQDCWPHLAKNTLEDLECQH